jgi:uridine kinase
MTNFYKPLKNIDRAQVEKGLYSFDHPDSIDFERFEQFVMDLGTNGIAKYSLYSSKLNKHGEEVVVRNPDLVILHGQFLLYSKIVRYSTL